MSNLNTETNFSATAENLQIIARLITTGIGLVITLFGLKYSIDIFNWLYGILKGPGDLQTILQQWNQVLDWEALKISLPLSNILSVIVLGGGTLILAWLALAMMQTGTKLITWTTSDREAIRRILRYAFGNSMRPPKSSN